MPADPTEAVAQALMKAGWKGSVNFGRDWLVPTLTAAVRTGPGNAQAGSQFANIRHRQFAVGWDGVNTFMPFTVGVSLILGTGLSTDIVVGS